MSELTLDKIAEIVRRVKIDVDVLCDVIQCDKDIINFIIAKLCEKYFGESPVKIPTSMERFKDLDVTNPDDLKKIAVELGVDYSWLMFMVGFIDTALKNAYEQVKEEMESEKEEIISETE